MRLPPVPAGTRWGSFPTTADTGVWARSSTLDGLFGALGTAMFAVMTDLRKVAPNERREVRATGPDLNGLLVAFLSELIAMEDTERFVARRVTAHLTLGARPTATGIAYGEPWDPTRHLRRTEVKAVTLHELAVETHPPRARVILDI
ncbi:MAG TPA: archease [Thermoplasmata archaeon]|nr:archease [Thermoplasmata archaeon]